MHMQKYAKNAVEEGIEKDKKFYHMAQILANKDQYLDILKMCVNKGGSLLLKTSQHMEAEKGEKTVGDKK